LAWADKHGCAQHSPASPFFERLLIVAINRMFDLEAAVDAPVAIDCGLFFEQRAQSGERGDGAKGAAEIGIVPLAI
jgi:hypothetical protein